MEKQTAVEQAIEYLRKNNLLSAAIILEDKFLPLEKQQIVMDYEMGYINGGNQKKITGEQYYESTFKTKEEK